MDRGWRAYARWPEADLDLLTPERLLLLAVIAGSIVALGAVSLNQLRLLTAGWALFTLFSLVGNIDLLAIQLACIALACVIGERVNRLTHAFGRGFAPDKVRIELYKIDRSRRIGVVEAMFIVAVAVAFAWLAAAPGVEPPPVAAVSASHGASPSGLAGARPDGPGAGGRSAAGRSAGASPAASARALPATPDIRHCLALGSTDAIVSCAESKE